MTAAAYENTCLRDAFEAASDLSSSQYYAVKLNGSNKLAICATRGERPVGILQDDPTSAQTGTVALLGISKAILGGTVTEMDPLTTDSSGKLISATDEDDNIIGLALQSGVSNDIKAVFLCPGGGGAAAGLLGQQTFVSSANYASSGQYCGVKAHTTAGQIVKCSSAGERALGILQNAPALSAEAQVVTFGPATAKAGTGGFTAGDALAVEADGELVTATNSAQVVAWALATVVEAATGSVFVAPAGMNSVVGAALADGKIWAGNGSGLAAAVTPSGDATMSNAGAFTVTDVTVGSDATGDLLYKSSATALARLGVGGAGRLLQLNAGNTAPQWSALSGDATIADGGAITVTDVTVGSDATGDLLYKSSATALARLATGGAGKLLQVNAGDTAPQWSAVSGDATIADGGALTVTDVTVGSDAKGDVLYKSSATALARRAIGTAGHRLVVSAADTIPVWDNGKIVKATLAGMSANDDPTNIQADFTVADGTTGAYNLCVLPDATQLGYFVLGAGQTITGPVATTDGIDIGCDQADNDGLEVFSHWIHTSGKPLAVGIDAAFYFLVKLNIQLINGCDDLFIGFRKAELGNSDAEAYNTYFGLGLNTAASPGALKVRNELNGGGADNTDTTNTIASATDLQVKILVSAAGVATLQHDAVTPGTLAAPAATAAMSFDDGDQLIPYVRFLHATAAQAGTVVIKGWEVGYQA